MPRNSPASDRRTPPSPATDNRWQDESGPLARSRGPDDKDVRGLVRSHRGTTERTQCDALLAGETLLRRFQQRAEARRSIGHLATVDEGEQPPSQAKRYDGAGGDARAYQRLDLGSRVKETRIEMLPGDQDESGRAVGVLQTQQPPPAGPLARKPPWSPAQPNYDLIDHAPEQPEGDGVEIESWRYRTQRARGSRHPYAAAPPD